jgi:hypothetical protein
MTHCQVTDRPKTGGIEAMGIVLRGDLIQSLQACGAFGAATSGSNAKQNTAAAPFATAANVHSQAPQTPPREPAAAAPSGRPPSAVMPIGPAMCPLLRRLENGREDSVRSSSAPIAKQKAAKSIAHRDSGRECYIDHGPDQPITYTCMAREQGG